MSYTHHDKVSATRNPALFNAKRLPARWGRKCTPPRVHL